MAAYAVQFLFAGSGKIVGRYTERFEIKVARERKLAKTEHRGSLTFTFKILFSNLSCISSGSAVFWHVLSTFLFTDTCS